MQNHEVQPILHTHRTANGLHISNAFCCETSHECMTNVWVQVKFHVATSSLCYKNTI